MKIGTKEEKVQVYTEVACLLKYFPLSYIKKLPNKLLEMIYKNSDEKYIIDVDLKKKLNNQDISDKTKEIFAVLTFNYWSNEEQKQNIKKQLYENEKAYKRALFKKYSTENLFDNNKNIVTNITTKEEQLTVYKESTLKKTIRKILEFFKR